jgi:hypothetical protein
VVVVVVVVIKEKAQKILRHQRRKGNSKSCQNQAYRSKRNKSDVGV